MEKERADTFSAEAEYAKIAPDFTEEDFLSGRLGYAMGFDNPNQIMVDLWGEGFTLTEPLNTLDAVDNVGMYCQAREQLAEYMNQKILGEYVQFGCAPALCAWYDEAARERRKMLIKLGARALAYRRGISSTPNSGYVEMDRFLSDDSRTIIRETQKPTEEEAMQAPTTFGSLHVEPATVDLACAVTGETSIVSVEFVLNSWQDMELVLGVELPVLLKGWSRFRVPVKHRSRARYDPVGMVGTPMEHCTLAFYQSRPDLCRIAGLNLANEEQLVLNFNPNITIGYSEKGLQKTWRKLGLD